MKLIYRIALRLSVALLPLMALWAALFYFTMVEEINDETDDALEDYSTLIISRMLAGRDLPSLNSGSNNSYSITLVDEEYANSRPHIEYYDADIFIPEKDETEPARILVTIFQDRDGLNYELKVATPTFDRRDLLEAIFSWVVILYFILIITTIGITVWIFQRSMRPLYELLHWLDRYTPGRRMEPVPDNTTVQEFRRLNAAAQSAVDRSEELFERQKQFIGNASHELQTPLAVMSSRIEWLIDNTQTDEQQTVELLKMQRTLSHMSRLNRTLLLLTKIDNGQFPESVDVDIAALTREQAELYGEIYASHNLNVTVAADQPLIETMNESLASTIVNNLIKNAFFHSAEGSEIEITVDARQRLLRVANSGSTPLDANRIFDRFYQGSKREGSTGLGLALAGAVARYYDLQLTYRFENCSHIFEVKWPQ